MEIPPPPPFRLVCPHQSPLHMEVVSSDVAYFVCRKLSLKESYAYHLAVVAVACVDGALFVI